MFGKSFNSVTINGKTINVKGNNISVINNKIYVDGNIIETGELSGDVHIIVDGNINKLETGSSATIKGDVLGDVKSGTSTTCQNINGSVKAGTSVSCGNVDGDVKAGTSISMKK